jgi:hypothetical protein
VHLGHDLLHLAPAFVSGAIEKSAAVSKRHYRRKQTDSGQGERPVGQPFENLGKLPRASRGCDAAVRGVLRQKQYLCAIDEERRAAGAKIQSPDVELAEECDDLCSRLPLVRDK